jgi:prolyl-tRNA editing enzyme YbaK/EbsC (Cys-tRNA(Pro) deacylase)
MAEHPNVERVLAAAASQGVALEVLRFPAGTRTAADAAAAVGCKVADIVKSLVFVADGVPVLALLSGVDRVDPAALGAALGAGNVRRATGDEAREATGVAIGGIPPFGHARELSVLMDEQLRARSIVWAAAGLPDAVFAIDAGDLARLARARVAPISEAVTADPRGG